MINNISTLLMLAKTDIQGAAALAKQANLLAEFLEALPTELAYKLNPNIR